MKVVIVEDEKVAARQLEDFVKSYTSSMQVLQTIGSCKALQTWLESGEDADLIFCDIELSDGNVLNTLTGSTIDTAIIFTTAYDHFWNEALKLNGIDYLLKPISEQSVHAALAKTESLQRAFSKENNIIARLSSLLHPRQGKFYKKRFTVRLNNEVFVLDAATIIFFRIVEGIIFAHTGDKKKYPLVTETLNDLETKLNPESFFRINRAEIINCQYITSIRINDGSEHIISLNGIKEKLVVSRSRINSLKEWLDNPQ